MHTIAHILNDAAARTPDKTALVDGEQRISYQELAGTIERLASSFVALGLERRARIAVWLDKSVEAVATMIAAAGAGMIFVPINPKLKAHQVRHILQDSGAAVLVTAPARLTALAGILDGMSVRLVLTAPIRQPMLEPLGAYRWDYLAGASVKKDPYRSIDVDPVAILYTSGSTGSPKGVVVSHRNLLEGARSVNGYLGTGPADVILSLLPLSFDAGLSQITTGIAAGATIVLHNYLRAAEAVDACALEGVTSITAVPPLWNQLSQAAWPGAARESVRLFATTGGHMPAPVLGRLRELFPHAKPFLMYGLTEAFRSTYLDPSEVDRRPGSIGKAIPNAEILVLREDGEPCRPGEVGELVHRGAQVSLGYWNDPARTAQRFRPLPHRTQGLLPEYGVWSGDFVKTDEEGFLYFVERRDEMIKSSGYRISPTEVENVLYEAPGVREAAVLGVRTEDGDQEVVALVVPAAVLFSREMIRNHCRAILPSYMVPRIVQVDELPRNANGKIDRPGLPMLYQLTLAEQLPSGAIPQEAATQTLAASAALS